MRDAGFGMRDADPIRLTGTGNPYVEGQVTDELLDYLVERGLLRR